MCRRKTVCLILAFLTTLNVLLARFVFYHGEDELKMTIDMTTVKNSISNDHVLRHQKTTPRAEFKVARFVGIHPVEHLKEAMLDEESLNINPGSMRPDIHPNPLIQGLNAASLGQIKNQHSLVVNEQSWRNLAMNPVKNPSNLQIYPTQLPGNIRMNSVNNPGNIPINQVQEPGNILMDLDLQSGHLQLDPMSQLGNLEMNTVQDQFRNILNRHLDSTGSLISSTNETLNNVIQNSQNDHKLGDSANKGDNPQSIDYTNTIIHNNDNSHKNFAFTLNNGNSDFVGDNHDLSPLNHDGSILDKISDIKPPPGAAMLAPLNFKNAPALMDSILNGRLPLSDVGEKLQNINSIQTDIIDTKQFQSQSQRQQAQSNGALKIDRNRHNVIRDNYRNNSNNFNRNSHNNNNSNILNGSRTISGSYQSNDAPKTYDNDQLSRLNNNNNTNFAPLQSNLLQSEKRTSPKINNSEKLVQVNGIYYRVKDNDQIGSQNVPTNSIADAYQKMLMNIAGENGAETRTQLAGMLEKLIIASNKNLGNDKL